MKECKEESSTVNNEPRNDKNSPIAKNTGVYERSEDFREIFPPSAGERVKKSPSAHEESKDKTFSKETHFALPYKVEEQGHFNEKEEPQDYTVAHKLQNGRKYAAYSTYSAKREQQDESRRSYEKNGGLNAYSAADVNESSSHGTPNRRAAGEVPVRRLRLSDVDEKQRGKSPSKKAGYCVDELCSCGLHKCVPSRPPLPFEGDSMYRTEFTPKPLERPKPMSEMKLPPSLPFEAESSYRTEYGPKPLPEPQKPVAVKLPPSLPFSGESAYRQHYGPKPLPAPQKAAEFKLPPSLPFEADSSYRIEYGPKPLPKFEPPPSVKLPPSLPFEGSTLYRDEFTPKPLPKQQQPAQFQLPQSLPFSADSVYRREYVPKECQVCQVTKLPQYPQATYPNTHVFWDPVASEWY